MQKVLFTECTLSPAQTSHLKTEGIEIKKTAGDLSENELIDKLQGCTGYIIGGTDKATKRVIESTELKIIVFWGTGYENYVDLAAARKMAIEVANTPKGNAYSVAEHTIALILSVTKQIPFLNNKVKSGHWERVQVQNLENRTLGIIGMGTVGGHVAKVMSKGFGMKILYVGRTHKEDLDKELGAKKVSLDNLCSNSDVISIHVPLTEQTKGMVAARQFSIMKSGAVLINTARAGIVDPKALRNALAQDRISTAAFDGYFEEPAPKPSEDRYQLLGLPNNKFIITPHNAYNTSDAVENCNEMVVENLVSFFKHKRAKYSVL